MFRVKQMLLGSLVLLFTVISTIIVIFNRFEVVNSSVKHENGTYKKIMLPFVSKIPERETVHDYRLILKSSILFSGKLQIIPDDCLNRVILNGKDISNMVLNNLNTCDTRNGIYFDLSTFSKKRTNILELRVNNTGGLYGIQVRDTTNYPKFIILGTLLLSICLVHWKQCFKFFWMNLTIWCCLNKKATYLTAILIFIFFILFLLATKFRESHIYTQLGAIIFFIIPTPILFNSIIKSLEFGKTIFTLLSISFTIWLMYCLIIPYDLYSYDHYGHLEYIKYIASYQQIPVDSGGWSFYHPSFYYRVSAFLWNFLDFNQTFSEEYHIKIMQAFSLYIFIFYIYFGLRIIDSFFKVTTEFNTDQNRYTKLIWICSISLFLFWPSNSIHAIRIGNDNFFYLFFAITFFFILKWWYSDKIYYFIMALIFCALNIWAKSNGILSLVIIGILLIIKYIYEKRNSKKTHNNLSASFLAFTFTVIVTVYFSFSERIKEHIKDSKAPIVVGNANQLGDNLIVGSDFCNFALFKPLEFVEIPFTNSFDDSKGRKNFWFYLLKTSLFGEFNFEAPLLMKIGSGISAICLLLMLNILIGIYSARNKTYIYIPMILAFVIFSFSMILFRIDYPYASSNDFRYIFPTIIIAVVLIGVGLYNNFRSKIILLPTLGFIITFIVFSIIFQILILADELGF